MAVIDSDVQTQLTKTQAFGTEESTRKVAEILSRIGGGLIATAGQPPAELPKDVTAKQSKARTTQLLTGY